MRGPGWGTHSAHYKSYHEAIVYPSGKWCYRELPYTVGLRKTEDRGRKGLSLNVYIKQYLRKMHS